MDLESENPKDESAKVGEDLQEELKFFLENRLAGLLDEAEKFRKVKQSVRKDRGRFLKKEFQGEKNQGFLPFLYSVSKNQGENREEPGSKVSGDEP
ncbi:hypothetical protein [Leptospira sarikeiensis]|uniref:Uncharacterized protein n=1 Tax=Leptospira sarikeiensis TaxID=2484943 RepID=A0A4R9K5V4_9LEPT|nr:hypothetical protein [Leptospira sarikeiensis]TGL61619.1 hypothetical protein EHQ64_09630 [Leptospira sarikeiensis]